MDRATEIYSLFEGVCPTCDAPTEMFRASGNIQFVVDQGWVMEIPEVNFIVRTEGVELSDIGHVEFRCQNEHEFYISYHKHGGWE